jgi:hypothetical protein
VTPDVFDEAGRWIAPPQAALAARPMGPWDANAPAPLHTVCSWCQAVMVEGDRTQPISHGLCAPCSARVERGDRG